MVQVPQGIRDSLESMHLPSIPEILLRFLHMVEDDSTSMSALAELVSQDPALTARILTVANSVAFRHGKPTTSLLKCMVTLGTRLSQTLASCLVIQKVFSPSKINSQYDLSGFWLHALRVADVCRFIAEQEHYPDPEEAHLTGLVHDIGQLLLLGGIEERYGTLLASSSDESVLRVLEEQRLGTDHAVIGAWMVDRWGITSSFMADAILFHHVDAEEIKLADRLSQIVWTAHLVCHHASLYLFEQVIVPSDFETSDELFAINFARAAELYKQATQRTALIAEALGVTGPDDGRTLPVSTIPFDPDTPKLATVETILSPAEEAVHAMALLKPLQHNLGSIKNESELYLAAQESARILFGLNSVAFLMLQQGPNILCGVEGSFQPELLQRLAIPLSAGCSLAVSAFQEQTLQSTLNYEGRQVTSLIDVQIGRIMGAERLIYLPMIGRSCSLGVMVCGVTPSHARRLLKRGSWLNSFAHAAASGIESWRELQMQSTEQETSLTRQFEQHTRKIAHEAGNPLSIINNYLSIMSKKLPADANIMQELGVLKEEIERVTQILHGMGDLSESVAYGSTVAINTVITSMLLLYKESLFESRGITVQLELDPDLPAIAVEQDRLKQILFNLWNNASDALHQGGIVQISTCAGFIQNGCPSIEIGIRDNGPGLPSDIMQQIFSPLDPKRRPGHSGMGLSIVADLVEQLDGRITCQSKAGQGTSFSILLPAKKQKLI